MPFAFSFLFFLYVSQVWKERGDDGFVCEEKDTVQKMMKLWYFNEM